MSLEEVGPYVVREETQFVEWIAGGETYPVVRPLRVEPGVYRAVVEAPLVAGAPVELDLQDDNVIRVRTHREVG